jgi:hypothetical protein
VQKDFCNNIGTYQRKLAGQSMSALPGDFRHQLVLLSTGRHPLQCLECNGLHRGGFLGDCRPALRGIPRSQEALRFLLGRLMRRALHFAKGKGRPICTERPEWNYMALNLLKLQT